MRQDPDHFGDQELTLVYIAKRLNEALRLEKLLTDAGLDYLVEPDKYAGGVIFRTERVGAFFYAAADQAEPGKPPLSADQTRPDGS